MDLVSADYAEKTQQIKRVLASQHRNSLANYKSDRDASGGVGPFGFVLYFLIIVGAIVAGWVAAQWLCP